MVLKYKLLLKPFTLRDKKKKREEIFSSVGQVKGSSGVSSSSDVRSRKVRINKCILFY